MGLCHNREPSPDHRGSLPTSILTYPHLNAVCMGRSGISSTNAEALVSIALHRRDCNITTGNDGGVSYGAGNPDGACRTYGGKETRTIIARAASACNNVLGCDRAQRESAAISHILDRTNPDRGQERLGRPPETEGWVICA